MSETNSTNLSKIEREELIAICERLRGDSSDPSIEADINRLITFIRSRKYGLMFEKHEEEVDRLLKDHLPAFYDAEDKTIKTKDTEDCNFLLEGDNLHSLKLLEKTHKGKIDVIYIDPPYNTGNNDFIYADSMVGQDDGFRHSKWLSFMKERLEIARDLLSNVGVIFISIDDNEQAQLKLLCDGIFGEENFISTLPRIAKKGSNKGTYFRPTKDYIICYAKDKSILAPFYLLKNKDKSEYKFVETDGINIGRLYKKGHSLYQASLDARPNQRYYIEAPDGTLIIPPGDVYPIIESDAAFVIPKSNNDGCWRWSWESYKKHKSEGIIMFSKSKQSPLLNNHKQPTSWNVYEKKYFDDENEDRTLPDDVIYNYLNASAQIAISKIGVDFSFSKPVELIKYIISLSRKNKSATILDFFAGSGTTGQAVLELNQEDGGDRHFILCTNNENNICEDITYQRLKTVITGIRPDGTKYSDGIKSNLKYFKTDMVAFDDEELEDKLITSSECLMQLENSSLLSSPDIDIAYCDEDLPDIFANKPHLKTLYLLEDVLFNAEQAKYIESHNIEIKRIADCYYEGV